MLSEKSVEILRAWATSQREFFRVRSIRIEKQSELDGNAVLWLHAPKHRVDVCVWNHAFCLDILVFDAQRDELVWSVVGSCTDQEGVLGRLSELERWLVKEYGPNTAS